MADWFAVLGEFVRSSTVFVAIVLATWIIVHVVTIVAVATVCLPVVVVALAVLRVAVVAVDVVAVAGLVGVLDAVVVSHCERKRCEEPSCECGESAAC